MRDRGVSTAWGWVSACSMLVSLPGLTGAEPALQPAAVHVDSCPSGAHVYLDDSLRGHTPLNLKDLVAGAHRIRLTLEGHSDRVIPFEATDGRRDELRVPLAPRPLGQVGRGMRGLFVMACPADATVFVDETAVGQGSAYVPDLAAGPHTVLVVRPGYGVREEIATVSPGAMRTLDVLLPAASAGAAVTDTRLLVETCPAGAGVVVDSRWTGTTPVELDVAPGRHRVAVALPDHEGRHEVVSVSGGTRRRLTLPLHVLRTSSPGSRAARLSIATCPAGLGVWVDGAQTDKSPVVVTVRPGPHQVGVQVRPGNPGHTVQQVVVQPGETLPIDRIGPLADAAEGRQE